MGISVINTHSHSAIRLDLVPTHRIGRLRLWHHDHFHRRIYVHHRCV
jgi:hypothetical protein